MAKIDQKAEQSNGTIKHFGVAPRDVAPFIF